MNVCRQVKPPLPSPVRTPPKLLPAAPDYGEPVTIEPYRNRSLD